MNPIPSATMIPAINALTTNPGTTRYTTKYAPTAPNDPTATHPAGFASLRSSTHSHSNSLVTCDPGLSVLGEDLAALDDAHAALLIGSHDSPVTVEHKPFVDSDRAFRQ